MCEGESNGRMGGYVDISVGEAMVASVITGKNLMVESMDTKAGCDLAVKICRDLGVDYERVVLDRDTCRGDLMGEFLYYPEEKEYRLKKGPLFTDVLILEGLHLCTPSIHSMLAGAISERVVGSGDERVALSDRFMIVAVGVDTECSEVSASLYERFAFRVEMDYMDPERVGSDLYRTGLDEMKRGYEEVTIGADEERYAIDIVHATRRPSDYLLDHLETFIERGAGSGAVDDLRSVSRAFAYLRGAGVVEREDMERAARVVLPHRIEMGDSAVTVNLKRSDVIEALIERLSE